MAEREGGLCKRGVRGKSQTASCIRYVCSRGAVREGS